MVKPFKPLGAPSVPTMKPMKSGVKPAGVTSDTEVPGVAQDAPSAAWGQGPQGTPPGSRFGVGLGGTPPRGAPAVRTAMPTPTASTNVMKDMIEKSKVGEVMDLDETAWKKLLQKFGSFD